MEREKVEIQEKFSINGNNNQALESKDMTIQINEEQVKSYGNSNTQNNDKLNLDDKQTYVLSSGLMVFIILISALTPVTIMLVCLFGFRQITLAMILYQVFLFSTPAIIIYRNKEILSVQYFLSRFLKNPKQQLLVGFLLMSGTFLAMFFSFVIIYDIQKDLVADTRVDLKKTYLNYVTLCLFLGVINPFLEEFYWRVFLQRLIEDSDLLKKTPEQEVADSQKLFNRTEILRWIISLSFGFYHMFTIAYFADFIKGFFGMVGIQIAGRIFIFVRDKSGYYASSLMHLGADAAILVIMFLIIYYVEKDKPII